MCLIADKSNPLKGVSRLKFDKNGYVTCWKFYSKFYYGSHYLLCPPYQSSYGFITNGWIVSNRESKELGKGYGDFSNGLKTMGVTYGIHVFTRKDAAKRSCAMTLTHEVVPVRCHESQLVAVGSRSDQAVFMRVFLKKSDYDEAVKG